jgi:hypothetical protein
MWLRPWHVLVCVVVLGVALTGCAFLAGDRLRDILLGLGVNLLSSIVFFILLELYWQRLRQANGKEVRGFNYLQFARNVGRSDVVRVLGTFIYPLTHHPGHDRERQALLAALADALSRPSFAGLQILFLHPESEAARARAAERRDDDVIGRIEEALATLRELIGRLDGDPARRRIEVRLFSRTPPFALFQTDNFASLSFFYRDRPVSEVTRYEFFVDSPLGVFVTTTFDDLWRDERTIPLEAYPGRLPVLVGAGPAGHGPDGSATSGRR